MTWGNTGGNCKLAFVLDTWFDHLKDERFLNPKNEKKQLSEGNTGGDRSWWRLPPPSVATYWPAVYKRVCIGEGH